MSLHIIAPNFEPSVVGGAGVALVELTARFLRDLPGTKIYLNTQAAALFPEWKSSIVAVRCGPMRSVAQKSLALGLLEALGLPGYPREGVCWFPFGPMLPLWFRGHGVATIHDTLDKDLPGQVPKSERMFRRLVLPRTVRKVTVVTDSRFSARRLQVHYSVDAVVIPLAVDPPSAWSEAEVPAKPYVFYPANAFPHKNHRFLLDLWQQTPALHPLALVFTMGSGPGSVADAIERARRAGVDVIVTGRVTRAELAGLYRSAQCTLLPSLYEGFGLPMQEALLSGSPVIANAGCEALHETVTTDYPLFRPLEHGAWADAILSQPKTSGTDLKEFVVRRTWEDCAGEYAQIFKRLGKSGEGE